THHRNRRPVSAGFGTFEEMHPVVAALDQPTETRSVAEWPIHRMRGDTKNALDLVDQIDRWTDRAVEFVDEGENRDPAKTADLKKLPRARFHALARIDDHDDGVDRGEHPVGVFREI